MRCTLFDVFKLLSVFILTVVHMVCVCVHFYGIGSNMNFFLALCYDKCECPFMTNANESHFGQCTTLSLQFNFLSFIDLNILKNAKYNNLLTFCFMANKQHFTWSERVSLCMRSTQFHDLSLCCVYFCCFFFVVVHSIAHCRVVSVHVATE